MSKNSRINIMQIEANARAPYAREVLRLTNLNNELVDALRECITDDGANCLRQSPTSATALRRRIAAINELARAVLAKLED